MHKLECSSRNQQSQSSETSLSPSIKPGREFFERQKIMERRPRRRILPPEQVRYDEFQPWAEWVQGPSNYLLLLRLPGFKMEELRVTPEKSGKITVRGRRQVGESRFIGFERSYDAPKDSNLEKITGKINNGLLELTVPKTAVVETAVAAMPFEVKKKEPVLPEMAVEERKEETVLPNEAEAAPLPAEERKEVAVLLQPGEIEEEATSKERVVAEAAAAMNESNKQPTVKEPKMASLEDGKAEATPKQIVEEPKPEKKTRIATEEREEEGTVKDKVKMPEEKKEENQKNVSASNDEKMAEEPTQMKPSGIQGNKIETIRENQPERLKEKNEESAKKEEPEKARHYHEGPQENQKVKDKGKRRRLGNEEDKCWLDWLDCEFIDCVLEKVKSNRKLITIALMVFSTGLYISKKLRKRG